MLLKLNNTNTTTRKKVCQEFCTERGCVGIGVSGKKERKTDSRLSRFGIGDGPRNFNEKLQLNRF